MKIEIKRALPLIFIGILAVCAAYGEELITVNAVGDLMIGTLFPEKRMPPKDGASIFEFSREQLTNGNPDILLGNLEGAMTHYPHTVKKIRPGYTYAFRMPPENVKYLKEAGFNVLTTANNHALDFDWRGYQETRKVLKEAGIFTAGNKDEILQLMVRDKKIAVLAFGWFERSNNILDEKRSMELIRRAKASNDIVILSVHGGAEGEGALHVKNEMEKYLGEKRGNLVRFFHLAVDNGADLIIGHGPHVPRAVELYKNRLIAYSLGNFATYAMATQGHKKYTLVLSVSLGTDGEFVSGKVIPMIQFEGGAYNGIPKYDPEARTVKLLQELSKKDFISNGILLGDDGELLKTGYSDEPVQ